MNVSYLLKILLREDDSKYPPICQWATRDELAAATQYTLSVRRNCCWNRKKRNIINYNEESLYKRRFSFECYCDSKNYFLLESFPCRLWNVVEFWLEGVIHKSWISSSRFLRMKWNYLSLMSIHKVKLAIQMLYTR